MRIKESSCKLKEKTLNSILNLTRHFIYQDKIYTILSNKMDTSDQVFVCNITDQPLQTAPPAFMNGNNLVTPIEIEEITYNKI